MNYILKCPICEATLFDPNTLREHRLSEHKSVYLEKRISRWSAKQYVEPDFGVLSKQLGTENVNSRVE